MTPAVGTFTFTATPTMILSDTPTFTSTETPAALPTATPTFTPTLCVPAGSDIYEDFEGATSGGNYTNYFAWCYPGIWAGCGSGDIIDMDVIDSPGSMHADGGSNAWHLTIGNDMSSSCYSGPPDTGQEGQFGLYSNTASGGGAAIMDYSCATNFSFWYYADAPIDTYVYWIERTTCASPNHEESYAHPVITLAGDSTWHKVSLPMSAFVLDPGDTSLCNGLPDQARVSFPWFQVISNNTATNLWIDHFRFE